MTEPENANPVIFLDIDGVLNSIHYFKTRTFLKAEDMLNQSENPPRRLTRLNDLNPEAIENLNEVVRKVDNLEIVLSSVWRKSLLPDQMTELMQERGFIGTIHYSTPSHSDQYSVRGNEIRHWLKLNRPGCFFNYVILDDDSDMLLTQKNNFLHIDGAFGFSRNHAYKVSRFLNKETNWL